MENADSNLFANAKLYIYLTNPKFITDAVLTDRTRLAAKSGVKMANYPGARIKIVYGTIRSCYGDLKAKGLNFIFPSFPLI
ncbi:Uncharacterised protein [Acetobacterium wieringae]|nr:Uncharacterised protein [Acetobacterium wieringae]